MCECVSVMDKGSGDYCNQYVCSRFISFASIMSTTVVCRLLCGCVA